jgi:hypothetical protein
MLQDSKMLDVAKLLTIGGGKQVYETKKSSAR